MGQCNLQPPYLCNTEMSHPDCSMYTRCCLVGAPEFDMLPGLGPKHVTEYAKFSGCG